MDAVAISVIAGLAAAMWSATISANIGRFSPVASIVIGGAVCIGGIYAARRRGALSRGPVIAKDGGGTATLLIVVALVAVRAWPPAVAWPAFLDGGWYAAAAALVSRQGGLNLDAGPGSAEVFVMRLADQRRAGIGVPLDESQGFHAVAFAVSEVGSGAASPYHPPFFTSWLAIFAALLGPNLLGTGAWPWAVAWAMGLGVLARRTLSSDAAPWAVAIAGISPLWRFFAPQPYAELTAGALVLAGLALLARRPTWSASNSPTLGPIWTIRPILAGILLGLAALTKLDTLPIVVAATAWWLWTCNRSDGDRSARDHRAAIALIVGLLPAVVHAGLIASGPSAVYYSLNLWGVRSAALSIVERLGGWAGSIAIIVMAVALLILIVVKRTDPSSGRDDPAVAGVARPGRARPSLALSLLAFAPALIFVALWLRDRPTSETVAAAPSMATILVWAITPLCAWAALATWALIIRSSEFPRLPSLGAMSKSPLAPAAVATAVVLLAPLVTRTLSPLYVGRRLLPIAFPLACILAAGGAAHAWRRGGVWRVGLVIAAIIVFAVQSMTTQALSPSRDLSGARLLIDRLVEYGSDDDLLIFPSSLTDEDAGRLASAVWALDGRSVAVVGAPEPNLEALAAAVLEVLETDRRVYWIGAAPPPVLEGVAVQPAGEESVITEVLAPDPALPPRMVRYELSVTIHELQQEAP